MRHYQLTSGVLSAKVVRYTQDYVFIELKFQGMETRYKQLTRDSFDGLTSWVKHNYDVLFTIK
jgi:hypothetical protein